MAKCKACGEVYTDGSRFCPRLGIKRSPGFKCSKNPVDLCWRTAHAVACALQLEEALALRCIRPLRADHWRCGQNN